MVTGGENPLGIYIHTDIFEVLSSTEILVHGDNQWSFSGPLPSPRLGLRGATISNKVIVTGGNYVEGEYYYSSKL